MAGHRRRQRLRPGASTCRRRLASRSTRYLDDVARRLKLGMTTSAHQVAAGMLAALHACADDRDGLLGYVGDMFAFAHSVFTLLTKHQQPLPDELLDTACPGWSPR